MLVKTIEFNVTVKNTVLNIKKEISLLCDTEDVLQEIRCHDEDGNEKYPNEIIKTDNKFGWECTEDETLEDINELAEQLEKMDSYHQNSVKAYMSQYAIRDTALLETATEKSRKDEMKFYPNMTLRDVAKDYVTNGIIEVPERLLKYFDYNILANELKMDGFTETQWGVINAN